MNGTLSSTPPAAGGLSLERSPRWVRARLGAEPVVDSRRAWVLHESGTLPATPRGVPAELEAGRRVTGSRRRGDEQRSTVRAGGAEGRDAAWGHPDPPPEAPAELAGLVRLEWAPWTSGGGRSGCTCTCATPSTAWTCSTPRATWS
ncbi:hypothetical protein [Miltoncostaea marina]|uniref:hypothetical protein n=1 Tax=Miltoncostaea marina TaxID=2843215 RepID=UPI001C3C2241|nr:hypothetical protein [Miltoncostaea marina]